MKPEADPASPEALRGFADLEGLRRLAARLVRSDADADDVVQESLLLGLRRTAGRIADVGSWLKGIVRNKARESLRASARRTARESHALPGKPAMDPIEVAARVEAHDELLAAVKRLDEPCRSAVWLHYVEGHEASDIARELETPVETVHTRIKRGVAKLREDLDRRHRGKRADWVPSLAAFAGVQPTLSLVAAGAAGAGVVSKPLVIAASALALLGLTVVGSRLITDRDDSGLTPPSPARSQVSTPASSSHESSDASTGKAATLEASPDGRPERRTIRPRPFEGHPPETQVQSGQGEGYFKFHYEQGYSFETKTISSDRETADLVFKSCAGGISSVTLEAPGGAILNLRRFSARLPNLKHAEALSRSVLRAASEAFGSATTAQADDRERASDAFLLRTRAGRYVVFAITKRDDDKGWTENRVTIRWAMNETEPVFRPERGDLTVDGVEVDSQLVARLDREIEEAAERARQERLEPFLRRLAELDRRAAAMEPSVQARDGADVRVAAVLDRAFAAPMGVNESYVAATYSFERATRDDVKATHNDWDFLLEHGGLRVRTVVDDRSLVWDLGTIALQSLRSGDFALTDVQETVPVVQGHVYVIHTADSDTDQWALMRIEELVPSESVIFSWQVIREPGAVQRVLESNDAVMQTPEVRLQIRGGAGGGNPFMVGLDGSTNVRSPGGGGLAASGAGGGGGGGRAGGRGRQSALTGSPLDLQAPLDINEGHTAYASGGTVPSGMVFLIERIEYVARVQGDSNGHGEFVLSIGAKTIARVREGRDADSGKKFVWSELDRADQIVAPDAMPVRGTLSVNVPIRHGEESRVYVEIANSSWADVTLSGRFVKAGTEPQPR